MNTLGKLYDFFGITDDDIMVADNQNCTIVPGCGVISEDSSRELAKINYCLSDEMYFACCYYEEFEYNGVAYNMIIPFVGDDNSKMDEFVETRTTYAILSVDGNIENSCVKKVKITSAYLSSLNFNILNKDMTEDEQILTDKWHANYNNSFVDDESCTDEPDDWFNEVVFGDF